MGEGTCAQHGGIKESECLGKRRSAFGSKLWPVLKIHTTEVGHQFVDNREPVRSSSGAGASFLTSVSLDREITGCLCMNQENVSLFLGGAHGSKLQGIQLHSWDFLPQWHPGGREIWR